MLAGEFTTGGTFTVSLGSVTSVRTYGVGSGEATVEVSGVLLGCVSEWELPRFEGARAGPTVFFQRKGIPKRNKAAAAPVSHTHRGILRSGLVAVSNRSGSSVSATGVQGSGGGAVISSADVGAKAELCGCAKVVAGSSGTGSMCEGSASRDGISSSSISCGDT
jgi:hypothetical protein